jgi:hypothetical protein
MKKTGQHGVPGPLDIVATRNRPAADRRRNPRDTPQGEPSRSQLIALITGTYREMPGLTLPLTQAARLFGLREATCRIVLEDLVRQGRLRISKNREFVAP